jgi:hypothetical protein
MDISAQVWRTIRERYVFWQQQRLFDIWRDEWRLRRGF